MKDEYIERTKQILGDDLVTMVKYNTGDEAHVLAVCKSLPFGTLKKLRQLKEIPIVFTVEEINNARDVFPVELLNIKRNYTLIFGKDIIKDIDIKNEDLRRQLEFEFRSKLFHLRQAYMVSGAKNDKELDMIILSAIPTMAPIIGALTYLKCINAMFDVGEFKKVCGINIQVLVDIYYIRKNKEHIMAEYRERYIQGLVTILEEIGKIVDKMDIKEEHQKEEIHTDKGN